MIKANGELHLQDGRILSSELEPAAAIERADKITASHLSVQAWDIYRDCPIINRLIQTYRPHICPFETLIPWIPVTGRILDVGCGSGLLLLLLASLNHAIDGVGLDEAAGPIAIARKAGSRTASHWRGVSLQFQHVHDSSSWPREEFDVVAMVDVLHHVPRPEQETLVQQAAARVRRGGIFLYKDMCRRPLWRAAANTLHDLCLAREWARYRSILEVEKWCRQSGLELKHREASTRFWYGHELRVMTRP